MSWDDHDRRRAALRAVLSHAARHPSHGLPFEQLPEVQQEFADRRELVLALQYDWTQALWAQIDLLSHESRRLADARELGEAAWTACAVRHPVLRRLLDCYRDELGVTTRREDGLLRFA
ncbi:MAG TPA: hypothetical protein VHC23_02590 [Jatrophihabitans sp.]|jgi:hypothetical protein|nr:hypothetical protein [Jatrophihabitans sp.]